MKITVNKENNTITLTGVGSLEKTMVLDITMVKEGTLPASDDGKIVILISKEMVIIADESIHEEFASISDLIYEVRKAYEVRRQIGLIGKIKLGMVDFEVWYDPSPAQRDMTDTQPGTQHYFINNNIMLVGPVGYIEMITANHMQIVEQVNKLIY